MTTPLRILFAGARIDRADHIRTRPDQLAAMFKPSARVLRLDGLSPVIDSRGQLEWGSLAEIDPADEIVFLGLLDGTPCFAPVAADLALRPPESMVAVWQAIEPLADDEAALWAGAKMLVDWHARHRFCARCGSATALTKGGWQRSCENPDCGAEHFPRVDPVTIMLVEHAGQLLLGRQHRFPPGMYSALAGFVEPGETIEEAVAREVHEEAGVVVRDVRYIASQPWPFPSSLMIGCHAVADSPELTIDQVELEEARWFTRDDVARAMAGDPSAPLMVPPHRAIAHQLLRWWLDRG